MIANDSLYKGPISENKNPENDSEISHAVFNTWIYSFIHDHTFGVKRTIEYVLSL